MGSALLSQADQFLNQMGLTNHPPRIPLFRSKDVFERDVELRELSADPEGSPAVVLGCSTEAFATLALLEHAHVFVSRYEISEEVDVETSLGSVDPGVT